MIKRTDRGLNRSWCVQVLGRMNAFIHQKQGVQSEQACCANCQIHPFRTIAATFAEHLYGLALFVKKTQTGVDGFKLHNMVADRKKSNYIGRIL